MKQPKVIMNNRNNVLPPPDSECSSPPCYAHEVDPVYMGLMQTEPLQIDALLSANEPTLSETGNPE